MTKNDSATFAKDGLRSLHCTCGHYLCDSYLIDNKPKAKKCKYCKSLTTIGIPKKVKKDNAAWITYGPDNCMWTVDQTQ